MHATAFRFECTQYPAFYWMAPSCHPEIKPIRSLDFGAILGTIRQLFGKDKYPTSNATNLVEETPERVLMVRNRKEQGGEKGGKVGKGGRPC